jgi:hypothetical protein
MLSRRRLLAYFGILALSRRTVGAETPRMDAAQRLSERNSAAMALNYVEDVSQIDAVRNTTFHPGQACANCAYAGGKGADAWKPCVLFPQKLVNTNGWCRAYLRKA